MKRRLNEHNWRSDPWLKALISALRSCKTETELQDLLRDVGTLGELQDWSERLEVAKQLSRGLSYRQVADKTGASTTTVTRVARFIENGAGGYRRYLTANKSDIQENGSTGLEAIEQLRQRQQQQTQGNGDRFGSGLRKYL